MTTASYKITRSGKDWAVNDDGVLEGDCATKEAAFEPAATAASNAIKVGYGIAITVEQESPRSDLKTKSPARLATDSSLPVAQGLGVYVKLKRRRPR